MSEFRFENVLHHLEEIGWAFLPSSVVTDPGSILRQLGPFVPTFRERLDYCDLIPCDKKSAHPASMSSIIGMGEQPMHTDAAYAPVPPRYIALQCLQVGESPCPTHIWVVDRARVLEDRPPVLSALNWVYHGGRHAPFYGSAIELQDRQVRVRYDPCCMRPISDGGGKLDEIELQFRRYTQPCTINWHQGALLILDNWRGLHARGAGADRSPSRRLRRWSI